MKVKLWGTRGSIPTPSNAGFVTSRFGGDTTCVSIESGELFIIIDGGSGVRLLGLELAKRKEPLHAFFFFSHVHWDHIQGFPFFTPGFRKENQFHLYGPRLTSSPGFVGSILEKALRGQQEDLNFPVQLKDMPANMHFRDLAIHEEVRIPGKHSSLLVRTHPLNHPGGCFGYRIEEHIDGKPVRVFAFCSDNEHAGDLNPSVQSLARDADLFLYDAQYTPEEYEGTLGNISHQGWGHSTWEWALREASAARAKILLLHHHDPLHDDNMVAAIESAAQHAAQKQNLPLKVLAAAQNAVFNL